MFLYYLFLTPSSICQTSLQEFAQGINVRLGIIFDDLITFHQFDGRVTSDFKLFRGGFIFFTIDFNEMNGDPINSVRADFFFKFVPHGHRLFTMRAPGRMKEIQFDGINWTGGFEFVVGDIGRFNFITNKTTIGINGDTDETKGDEK